MNIEIANRLQKLRKEKGLSQEELADELGISRQAVSKWERAEASPDTDNLICLAKLYNISLDEILDTDETVEEIKQEQKDKEEEKKIEVRKSAAIGKEGIHLIDEDGSEVFINSKGVRAFDSDGQEVVHEKKFKLSSWLSGVLTLLSVAGYLIFGFTVGYWGSAWVLFLLPEIICSVIRCFEKKNPREFNIALLATYVFFVVCMVHPGDLWHPMWVVFLSVPIYHSIVSPFTRKKKDCCDNEKDD